MMRVLELSLSTVLTLSVVVGCGGSSSNDGGGSSAGTPSGGASGTGGEPVSNGGAAPGGATSGGASQETGGTFSTSIPASTPVADLTDDQLAEICKEVKDFTTTLANDVGDFECKALAVISASQKTTDADVQAACKASVAACVPSTTTTTSSCTHPDPSCKATVGETVACLNDTVSTLQTANGVLPSCDKLTRAQALLALAALAGTGAGPASPASCTKFQTDCPNSDMVPPMGN